MTRDERQEICVTKWVKSKCRSTIVGPTGIGKSIIGIKCIKKVLCKYPYVKVLIVVPTIVLKDQWQNLIDKNELSFNCEVMVINTAIKQEYSCNILVVDEQSCRRKIPLTAGTSLWTISNQAFITYIKEGSQTIQEWSTKQFIDVHQNYFGNAEYFIIFNR